MPSLSFLFLPPNYKVGMDSLAGLIFVFDDASVTFDQVNLTFEGNRPVPPPWMSVVRGANSLMEV